MNGEPENPNPGPEPEPQGQTGPGPQPVQTPAVEQVHVVHPPERPKRKLVYTLAVLYGVSVLAAVLLLMRSPSKETNSKPSKDATGLLSALSAPTHRDGVGWVNISGPIYRNTSSAMFEKGVSQWAKRIHRLSKKKEVKAIVIAINSPGGSVGAVQELHSLIVRVRRETKKPIVAHLGDVAASGGYYLAAACDKVVAHPGSLVGSIGVIFHTSNIEGLFKKIGVKSDVIKSGKMKDIGSMTRPMTPEEHRLLQGIIDNAFGQFFRAVAEGRKMPPAKLKPLADGRIFTGEQALEAGLVDQVGDTHDAIMLAAKLGGIKDKKPRVIRGSAESFADILEMLDSRSARLFSPRSEILSEIEYQFGGAGLEYRWR